jgi:hypothetical protein
MPQTTNIRNTIYFLITYTNESQITRTQIDKEAIY